MHTTLRAWTYAHSYYDDCDQRAEAFHSWMHQYNWNRAHASLGQKPPLPCVPLDNLLG